MTDWNLPIEAKGTNGTLVFDGTMVSLVRSGAGRILVGKGSKRIPIGSITAVQWKKAGLVAGYIQFTIAGGNEVRSKFGRQSADAMSDENSVTFHVRQQPHFEIIRDAIEATIASRQNGQATHAPQQPTAMDRMAQLQSMLEHGMISQAEYDAKRQEILSQL